MPKHPAHVQPFPHKIPSLRRNYRRGCLGAHTLAFSFFGWLWKILFWRLYRCRGFNVAPVSGWRVLFLLAVGKFNPVALLFFQPLVTLSQRVNLYLIPVNFALQCHGVGQGFKDFNRSVPSECAIRKGINPHKIAFLCGCQKGQKGDEKEYFLHGVICQCKSFLCLIGSAQPPVLLPTLCNLTRSQHRLPKARRCLGLSLPCWCRCSLQQ